MSEQLTMFRHPLRGTDGPIPNFQQQQQQEQGDLHPPPSVLSMARPPRAPRSPAQLHSQSSNFISPDVEAMDAELWYACAGPQHMLPPVNSLVAYFPQGHIEQVASFNNPDVEGHVPRYDLPAAIPCTLNDIRLSADRDTDEVFATLTLCPVSVPLEKSMISSEPPGRTNLRSVSFTKILTVSDTSTHGGFSVPRRGAEDCFPPLDKSLDNPIQDLVAKDLHGNEWKFRHLFRGQPKRHLLTTGWSIFVAQKRLVAGDAVLFLRDKDDKLRIAVRLAPRQQKQQAIMVTSTMAIGVLEAAAHAASEKSRFSMIYNPRSCPSQFVIPYWKYDGALKRNFAVGQRIKSEYPPDPKHNAMKMNSSRSRTRSEAEDSSDCRSTGTIIDISDYDRGRWPGSVWRSLEVKWDELSGESQERISPWEVAPVTARPGLPPQDRMRKRSKAGPPQSAVARHGPGVTIDPGTHVNRLEPVPTFGGVPSSGLQDLLGYRSVDILRGDNVDFGMQVYRAYKVRCDQGSPLLPSSPRQATLHSFVKAEPLSDADLQLRVSSSARYEQTSKAITNPQPSLAALRDPPGWPPAFRSHSETGPVTLLSIPDVLSISTMSPETGSSSHSSTPKSNVWESQMKTSPPQTENKCRIFGVSLDTPAETVSTTRALNGFDEVSSHSNNGEKVGESVSSSGLTTEDVEDQNLKKAGDWQLKLGHKRMDTRVEDTNFDGYGELIREVKHISID